MQDWKFRGQRQEDWEFEIAHKIALWVPGQPAPVIPSKGRGRKGRKNKQRRKQSFVIEQWQLSGCYSDSVVLLYWDRPTFYQSSWDKTVKARQQRAKMLKWRNPWTLNILTYFFNVYDYFASTYVCALYACLVSADVRRKCRGPWN